MTESSQNSSTENALLGNDVSSRNPNRKTDFADMGRAKLFLLFCGVTTVLPWNFFMSAYDYYMMRLRVGDASNDFDSACVKSLKAWEAATDNGAMCQCSGNDAVWGHVNETITLTSSNNDDIVNDMATLERLVYGANGVGSDSIVVDQKYQKFWNSYLSFATMGTVLMVALITNTSWFNKNFPAENRVSKSLIVVLGCLVVTIMMIYWHPSVDMFFKATLLIVLIINAFGSVYQTTMFQVTGELPMVLLNMMLVGQAAGGVFANIVGAIAGVIMNAVFYDNEPVKKSNALATLFFLIACVVVYITLQGYMKLQKCDVIQHYSSMTTQTDIETPKIQTEEKRSSNMTIITQCYKHYFAVWFTFAITLAYFPTMVSEIRSNNFFWSSPEDECKMQTFSANFFKLGILMMFNIGDYVGRSATNWPGCSFGINKDNSGFRVVLMALARVFFYAIFNACNINGTAEDGNFMHTDLWAILMMLLFGITNGYVGGYAMQYAPEMVKRDVDKGPCGGLVLIFLTAGLLTGAISSFAVIDWVAVGKTAAMTTRLNSLKAGVVGQCFLSCSKV